MEATTRGEPALRVFGVAVGDSCGLMDWLRAGAAAQVTWAVERAPAHCAVVSSAVVFEKLCTKANPSVRWLQVLVLGSGAGGSPVPFSTSVAQRGVHAALVALSIPSPPAAPLVADTGQCAQPGGWRLRRRRPQRPPTRAWTCDRRRHQAGGGSDCSSGGSVARPGRGWALPLPLPESLPRRPEHPLRRHPHAPTSERSGSGMVTAVSGQTGLAG